MTGFIGGGNMAEAIIRGMTSQGMNEIVVSEPREERRKFLEQTFGIRTSASNLDVAKLCDVIILAVKPQNMEAVLMEIGLAINEDKTVVSIAAGITLAYLEKRLKTTRLVRVMSNTPALVQEAMSVFSLCSCLPEPVIAPVREIFMSIGKVVTLPEKHMNTVTALSGSGPGFIALFIEGMIDAGEKMGLTRETAHELTVQTLLGTALLLDTRMSPERLRQMVTSPGGTTAAGLDVFNERGLTKVIGDALKAAQRRGEELGGER